MAETLLQVKDLIKEYEGNRILDGVNLEIEQGQVVVVVGPSGCGKVPCCAASMHWNRSREARSS